MSLRLSFFTAKLVFDEDVELHYNMANRWYGAVWSYVPDHNDDMYGFNDFIDLVQRGHDVGKPRGTLRMPSNIACPGKYGTGWMRLHE